MITSTLALVLLTQVSAPTISIEVEGEGFLRFTRDGRMLFARQASLTIVEGRLVALEGPRITPSLFIEGKPERLQIDPDGTVRAGNQQRMSVVGRLSLVRLATVPTSQEGFLTSSERGVTGIPGQNGYGTIRSAATQPTRVADSPRQVSPTIVDRARVTIRLISDVDRAKFTLGDIAEITASDEVKQRLSAVIIGDTPALGVSRGIDQARIHARLLAAKIQPESILLSIPNNATIRRSGNEVTHQQFVDFAKQAIQEELGKVELEEPTPQRNMIIPKGSLTLESDSIQQSGTRISLTIAAVVDGVRVNTRAMTFTLSAESIAVKSGQNIVIRLISAGVKVQIQGRARSQGLVGQMIPVVTMENVAMTGRVVEPGVVEVKL